MSDDDRKEYTHPSYGMIAFNRSMGGRPVRLFGSPLEEHYGTVRIVIGSGTRIHEHNMDRYHGSLRGEHMEVEMSAAQFAEVLTSMNQGSGIPCTIRYIAGVRIEDPPAVKTETRKIQSEFKETIDGYAAKAKEYAAEIMTLCERLPAKTRERIRINLDVIRQQLTSNVPFVLKQFTEATTRVVTAAKHEIDQFAQHVGVARPPLHGLEGGMRALAEASAPTYNHTRGDSALTPCPICKEPEAEPELSDIVMENRQRSRGRTTLPDVKARVAASENKTQTFHAEQLAYAINGYLEEFEAIPKMNDKHDRFYNAGAISRGNGRVQITYVSYQGESLLTIEEAEQYLAWLDKGNIGRHFEALKRS